MLIGLQIAMRFERWERSGVPIHLALGLPFSTDVLKFVATHKRGPELQKVVTVLSTAVMQIVSEHLLWSQHDGVEMVIARTENESHLIDSIAELVLQAALRKAACSN